MPYQRSIHRTDFVARIDNLLAQARKADRKKRSISTDHREMIFQCAVFQASAATESYLRLVIESWMQRLSNQTVSEVPINSRAYVLSQQLASVFAKYHMSQDEKALIAELSKPHQPWAMMVGEGEFPRALTGSTLHARTSFPSQRNINKLFGRIGIPNMVDSISGKLCRDASMLIESFQSVRTALAHSAPPELSLVDVERLLSDSKTLVSAVDRIFHSHVQNHGGNSCWPAR